MEELFFAVRAGHFEAQSQGRGEAGQAGDLAVHFEEGDSVGQLAGFYRRVGGETLQLSQVWALRLQRLEGEHRRSHDPAHEAAAGGLPVIEDQTIVQLGLAGVVGAAAKVQGEIGRGSVVLVNDHSGPIGLLGVFGNPGQAADLSQVDVVAAGFFTTACKGWVSMATARVRASRDSAAHTMTSRIVMPSV